jgi:hypothetical protein
MKHSTTEKNIIFLFFFPGIIPHRNTNGKNVVVFFFVVDNASFNRLRTDNYIGCYYS